MKEFYQKNSKKIFFVVVFMVVIVVIWFLILGPLVRFKVNESTFLNATKRYYEINNRDLPTGNKIRTISLQRIYDKDLIEKDLKTSYMSKLCDPNKSWVKVRKEGLEYKYYVYLECGIFRSSVDHDGPKVTLKGDEVVTIDNGSKFVDPGISSVVDNTDGDIDINKVKVVSNVNTNKNGTYKVAYSVRDSWGNQTIKERVVNVVQVLNRMVKKATKNTNNYFQSSQENNYVMLDGIVFKVVGYNKDGTVKIVSNENLGAVNYDGIDKWLNDYFYNKLSDSAKKYIVDSSFCNESVSNTENYTSCNSLSNKKKVGLLSVADINNSKSEGGESSLSGDFENWTSNKNISNIDSEFKKTSKSKVLPVRPVVNLKQDTYIAGGSGYSDDPYVLKGNKNKIKVGSSISELVAGTYIKYSGYNWRVIGSTDSGDIELIMDDVANVSDDPFITKFNETSNVNYNPSKKGNIAYNIINRIGKYLDLKTLKKTEVNVKDYTNNIEYGARTKDKKYTAKVYMPSLFTLFSTSYCDDYWYSDYSSSSKTYCYMSYQHLVICEKYSEDIENGIRAIIYLDKDIKILSGEGTGADPYIIKK